MNKLFKSSNYWAAVTATIVGIAFHYIGVSSEVTMFIIGLFAIRQVATGFKDMENIKHNEI